MDQQRFAVIFFILIMLHERESVVCKIASIVTVIFKIMYNGIMSPYYAPETSINQHSPRFYIDTYLFISHQCRYLKDISDYPVMNTLICLTGPLQQAIYGFILLYGKTQ